MLERSIPLLALLIVPTAAALAPDSAAQSRDAVPRRQPIVQSHHRLERADTVVVTWEQGHEGDDPATWCQISTDAGRSFSRPRQLSYELLLRAARFDPVKQGQPPVPRGLAAAQDHELFIVQYITQGLEPWRREIEASGAVHRRYLANHSDIWRVDAATARRLEELPFVRWVGPYHPVYKLEDALRERLVAGTLQETRVNVMVGERGPREKHLVAAAIERLGGTVELFFDSGFRFEATLDAAQLRAVAGMSEVLWIDSWGEPETDMNHVRAVMGADFLEATVGFTGSGVRAEVLDQGLDTVHPDWTGARAPIIHNGAGSSLAHGTAVFGIVFGAGASDPNARGVLPDGQGIFASFSNLVDRYLHTQELLSPPYEAVFQTNSWGGPRTTAYTSKSAEMDDIAFLTDLAIVQTQGAGPLTQSRPEAWAKNVISVGGNLHFDNALDSDDMAGGAASTGPAEDGRIKPDFTAYADSVWTSDAEPGGYVSGGTSHPGFGGSSAATPMVAGHLGLILEMWHAGLFGNPVGATVFDSRPHATLAKALLVNGARQYPDTQADFTRFNQGWGKPDLQSLYDERDLLFYVDESDLLQNLQSKSYRLLVPAGAAELKATLVYIDPMGTPGSVRHRVNDLSLQVTDPNGVSYWGNQGLTSGSYNFSAPGGTPDEINTVENVFVDSPAPGVWTVEVFADEVNQDTHLENGTSPMDVDYALVVTPVDCEVDRVLLSGPASTTVGATVTYGYAGAPPSAPFGVAYSLSLNGSVVLGQCLDIGPTVTLAGTGVTSPSGNGSWTSNPIPPNAAGRRVYVEMGVLVAGELMDSNALSLDVL